MSDNGFIVLLSFGAALLSGILAVAHVSAHRLKQRRQLRREKQALAEPELDFSGLGLRDIEAPRIRLRHAEPAR